MAVKREEYEVDLKTARKAVTMANLIRRIDGGWTLELEIDGVFPLDDDRSVRFEGQVRLRGRQRGRKSSLVKRRVAY